MKKEIPTNDNEILSLITKYFTDKTKKMMNDAFYTPEIKIDYFPENYDEEIFRIIIITKNDLIKSYYGKTIKDAFKKALKSTRKKP